MPKKALDVPVFAGLSMEALDALAREAKPIEAKCGELIVKEGSPGHSMFIIASGQVEVVKQAGGSREVVLATLGRGQFFGEMCLVELMPRVASVRAVKATACWELQAASLHHLFHAWPDQFSVVILNIARDLARRLRTLDEVFAARAY